VQISLRSHLIAGTAAVVGASAIAMTPVMGAQLSLPAINVPTVAKVTLAGLDSPISELLGSVILGGQLLFNTQENEYHLAMMEKVRLSSVPQCSVGGGIITHFKPCPTLPGGGG
jgi:branched-subunit amino acid ABC-type transport system permease component